MLHPKASESAVVTLKDHLTARVGHPYVREVVAAGSLEHLPVVERALRRRRSGREGERDRAPKQHRLSDPHTAGQGTGARIDARPCGP